MSETASIDIPGSLLLASVFLAVVFLVLAGATALAGGPSIRQRLRLTADPDKEGGASLRYGGGSGNARTFMRQLERSIVPQDGKKRSAVRRRLVQAGYYNPHAVTLYYAVRIGLALALPVLALIFLPVVTGTLPAQKLFAWSLGMVALGFYGPALFVTQRIGERQRIVREAFPDTLDLLLVCVEAGLGLNAAIVRVAAEIRDACPLMSEHFNLASMEMQAGASREIALRNLGERVDVREVSALVSLLIQSDSMGVSVAHTLRIYAAEMRRSRIVRAEEHANKLPVRMVLPLAGFVMPAFIIVITAPSLIRILRALLPSLTVDGP